MTLPTTGIERSTKWARIYRNCVTLFRQRGGDAERGLEACGHISITGRRATYGNTCRAVDTRGIGKGERKVLLRQVRRRFGEAAAQQSERLLVMITAPAQLEDLGEMLLECEDEATWLNQLQAAAQVGLHNNALLQEV
jgi:Domain of unknown function (DUF4351)